MADALAGLLESREAERLATGFVFTEGPLWHPDGFFYFVDLRVNRLHKIVPGQAAELVLDQCCSWMVGFCCRQQSPRQPHYGEKRGKPNRQDRREQQPPPDGA